MTGFGKRASRLNAILYLALAGGTLCGFGACQSRVKESVVAGTQDFIATLLSPNVALDFLNNLAN